MPVRMVVVQLGRQTPFMGEITFNLLLVHAVDELVEHKNLGDAAGEVVAHLGECGDRGVLVGVAD